MSAKKDLWALDFDGVVCDSVGESSVSAWKASERQWPDLFAMADVQARKGIILDKMRQTRPVIETGYENLVLVRYLLEGAAVDDVLLKWHTLLPELMAKWDLDRSKLVELFGTTRDEWMKHDLKSWLAANSIYPQLSEILSQAVQQHEVYIVTTKQARFTEALLREAAQLSLPSDRIFSTADSGQPKSEVLAQLKSRHPACPAFHFLEDKLGTLNKVQKLPDFADWQLYLADWGYNTATEKQEARDSARIELISRDRLRKLLM